METKGAPPRLPSVVVDVVVEMVSSPRPPLWLWLWLWWKLRYNVYLIHQMKELHCVRAHAHVLHACLCTMLLSAGVRICMDH